MMYSRSICIIPYGATPLTPSWARVEGACEVREVREIREVRECHLKLLKFPKFPALQLSLKSLSSLLFVHSFIFIGKMNE